MSKIVKISALAAVALTAGTVPATAQTAQDQRRFEDAQRRFDSEVAAYRAEVDRYVALSRRGGGGGYSSYDPRYRDPADDAYYDPTRDYRDGRYYQERTLGANDRVYAGTDGRYYCRRSDGTTGLIVGAGAGGILGNVIDGGRSRTVGTLLGAAAGALAGRAIDQNQSQVRCR